MGQFDRGSKWLIERHGDSLLRLAGVRDVVSWRALPAEIVQPGQLPDGLLEAYREGKPDPELFVLELATYPERRVVEQLERDSLLVLLNRRELPDAVAIVLRPKGRYRVPATHERVSRSGLTQLSLQWRVVELWTLPAEELLAVRDPGLVPWIPLTRFGGSPVQLFRQCREIIDEEAPEAERPDLLAVTQILARLRYNDPRLFLSLGGERAVIESPYLDELREKWLAEALGSVRSGGAMIESPLLKELREKWTAESRDRARAELELETRAKDLLLILRERFGEIGDDSVRAVREASPERLQTLFLLALRAGTLAEFQRELDI